MNHYFLIKHKYFFLCAIPNFLLLMGYYENYIESGSDGLLVNNINLDKTHTAIKYLVDTENCKIPDIDPFNDDMKPYYRKVSYESCTSLGLLTYMDKNRYEIFLRINQSLVPSYTSEELSCCYQNVTRGNGINIDYEIKFSECESFESSVRISHDLIKVECKSEKGDLVYSNVHSIMSPRGQSEATNNSSYSILLVGIDTMSQLNFARTMPKSHKFLDDQNWVNLRGYNKIADNTFPNLMAILSGMNLTQLETLCHCETESLDNCPILWKKFQESKYVTAYAEDEASINTFNHLLHGFNNTPTDLYFRPYFMAAETLEVVRKYFASYCTGPETSGERVLNLIRDYWSTFEDDPKFALFWMNTFSHNNINSASAMDEVFVDFFRDFSRSKTSENTIMVFFSDHGFRFGKSRYTYTGWLEERLPISYMYIPESFQKEFPESYQNLRSNQNQLTTPFDLYMTLQDILHRGNDSFQPGASLACPKCRSLFEKVSVGRSCADADISQHFCTCLGHVYIDPNSQIVRRAASFALNKLRDTIDSFEEGPKNCIQYDLKRIISSGISESFSNSRNVTYNFLLIVFETYPKAVFEATVEVYPDSVPLFIMEGIISRIDRYGNTSECVRNRVLRKYCHCGGVYKTFTKTLDILFNN